MTDATTSTASARPALWFIDDTPSNRNLYSNALESFGWHVTTFASASKAIARAAHTVPDLVITDVRMPVVDGFECCRRLRQAWGDELVPIIMLTAVESRDHYVRGLEAGADDYLIQPIDFEELRVRVRSLLRLRQLFVELRHAKAKLTQRVDELREDIATRERQLVTNDRLAAIGQLAAATAHDIRNPLTFVTSNIQHCLELPDGPANAEWKSILEAAKHGADRIQEVVRDLTTFSRAGQQSDRRAANVQRVITSATNMAQTAARHVARIHFETPNDSVWASITTGRLAQVMLNLIINAAHAIEDVQGATGDIYVRVETDDGMVRIEVEDTGIGMSADHLAHIFTPFYTTKHEDRGTGLGLSICRDLVTEAGGTIAVTSLPGQGSRFRVELPLAAPPLIPEEQQDDAIAYQQEATPNARVVIVDDEPLVAPALRRMLTGYQVTSYGSLELAAPELEQADVILCDLLLPGSTPIDLYKQLPESVRARMIFITGGACNDRTQEFIGEIPNITLEKPVDRAELRHHVATLIARSSSLPRRRE